MPEANEVPYIDRALRINDETCTVQDLAQKLGVAVVLAEPGAGKTRLLEKLGEIFGVPVIRASIFKNKSSGLSYETLIVDAFDEVTKLDQLTVDDIIVKASEAGAKRVVLASRSGEWEESRSKTVKDAFEKEPIIVRLNAFSVEEQRSFFAAIAPQEDFEAFYSEVERVDLLPLAELPQFLTMFIGAYIESDGRFESKMQVYSDSIKYAARETNADTSSKSRPAVKKIIKVAERLFSILILAGSSGVATSDAASSRDYPKLNGIIDSDDIEPYTLLDTKFFQPMGSADQHQTTHRIVVEYCAGRFLCQKIQDPSSRLTLDEVLSLIAPNNVVRDDLRGLLSWMAVFGTQDTQSRIIKLDPYAVIANGDPGQLSLESKRLLLSEISIASKDDPYFRRTDKYRRFNVTGFFTDDLMQEVGEILSDPNTESSLKNLLLELLRGASHIGKISGELEEIVLDEQESSENRELALGLLEDITIEKSEELFRQFIRQTNRDNLYLASLLGEEIGYQNLAIDKLFTFFQGLAALYRDRAGKSHRTSIGSLYFIRGIFSHLSRNQVEVLLDRISDSFICNCNKQRACRCFKGESKIIGFLLDRLFELNPKNVDPSRIRRWTKRLYFENPKSPQDSISVRCLSSNNDLRQCVQKLAFEDVTNREEISSIMFYEFNWHAHSGLSFRYEDREALTVYAFESGNLVLWEMLYVHHNKNREEKGVDPIRKLMCEQSRKNPAFLKVWTRREKATSSQDDKDDRKHRRKMKRLKLRNDEVIQLNKQHYLDHKEVIESGKHWNWMRVFASRFLHGENQGENLGYISETSMSKTLRNSFPFLMPYVPTLKEVATKENPNVLMVLEAACVAWFRKYGTLEDVDTSVLRAVKAGLSPTQNISKDEISAVESEINRIIFKSENDIRAYAKEFLVPQISNANLQHSDVGWLLSKEEFSNIRADLAINWLEQFPNMKCSPREYLFEQAAIHVDASRLSRMIRRRYRETLVALEDNGGEVENKRHNFWALRAFLYLPGKGNPANEWLTRDKKNIFFFDYLLGSLYKGSKVPWIDLSSDKIFQILDAYVEEWPKTYLPNSWGSHSPDGERAYRFLTEIIWKMQGDDPERILESVNKILDDERFEHFHDVAKTLLAEARRCRALREFQAPSAEDVAAFLSGSKIVSVENLRAVLIELLQEMQREIKGGPTDLVDTFYGGDERVDEPSAANRVVDFIKPRLISLGLSAEVETHMSQEGRCDITISTVVAGKQILLAVEAKGQWHGV